MNERNRTTTAKSRKSKGPRTEGTVGIKLLVEGGHPDSQRKHETWVESNYPLKGNRQEWCELSEHQGSGGPEQPRLEKLHRTTAGASILLQVRTGKGEVCHLPDPGTTEWEPAPRCLSVTSSLWRQMIVPVEGWKKCNRKETTIQDGGWWPWDPTHLAAFKNKGNPVATAKKVSVWGPGKCE